MTLIFMRTKLDKNGDESALFPVGAKQGGKSQPVGACDAEVDLGTALNLRT